MREINKHDIDKRDMDKKELSETDICDQFITPALKQSGWNQHRQIRREYSLTPGPIIVRGNMSVRNKKKRKFADYVLSYEPGVPVAVIEAKKNTHTVSHGLQQALGYAEILDVPSVFSSNGDAFASHNRAAEPGQEIESQFSLADFPTPQELWQGYRAYRGIQDSNDSQESSDQLLLQPYHTDGTDKEPRYYQIEAINRVMEAVVKGQQRMLLVMATGTGKTYTTFQIIWRLWKAGKARRILFLVDRNILADQTLVNDFKPFGSVMTKVKNRTFDPAYEIHLALYQAISGPEEADKIYKNLSRDFFDLIVIDECHRGSAAEDSDWREILDYFSSAVQLGLTATPKETKYVSNMSYFGEPVYTYSLKQGIEDGFLAPYKVIRIHIDKDIEGWQPAAGLRDDLGKEVESRVYDRKDMDRILVLERRTKLVARRVMAFLRATDPMAKTIIFCEDIDHAERMRSAIVNEAGQLALDNPKYVMRITGDNPAGKAELDNFIDPESPYPVIATTSELMSTGVDAKTCKLIVLDKSIKSMTMFKQIIGRGTRIDEEHNKFFFTIMDFKNATALFRDPAFDGDPVDIYEPGPDDPPLPPESLESLESPDQPEPAPYGDGDDRDDSSGTAESRKIYIRGVSVRILTERVEYIGPDGILITESYRAFSRKQIRSEFASLDDFLQHWQSAEKKKIVLELLEEQGVVLENLAAEVGQEYGAFDLICHIVFDQPPLTRKERAEQVKKRDYFTKYGEQARAVLNNLLDQYADTGICSIEHNNILKMKPFNEIGTPLEIINQVFGGKNLYRQALVELEKQLYLHSLDSLEKSA
ncbi:MAG: DEAD/DEAH box helicase family protein [Candidatus Electrothrix sp. Rat3]|nr:DEAD/DEAH box helicase family protein [Candidatus Electrothrix rattekaaiensis]